MNYYLRKLPEIDRHEEFVAADFYMWNLNSESSLRILFLLSLIPPYFMALCLILIVYYVEVIDIKDMVTIHQFSQLSRTLIGIYVILIQQGFLRKLPKSDIDLVSLLEVKVIQQMKSHST